MKVYPFQEFSVEHFSDTSVTPVVAQCNVLGTLESSEILLIDICDQNELSQFGSSIADPHSSSASLR